MALPFSFGLEMGSEGRLCLNAKHVTLINPLRSSVPTAEKQMVARVIANCVLLRK